MAEFIERETACSLMPDDYYGWRDKQLLKSAPTADVAPVRHGRWSRIDYEPIGHDYICSVCGWRNDMASHYCPNCGAKMDKEVQDG